MVRIVGVQRDASPDKEFILLQNQGSLRAKLRGHLIAADVAFDDCSCADSVYAFPDAENIPAGMFVILFSGFGEPRWAKTKEGQLVYYTFMGKEQSVWDRINGPIHILCTQHTYAERPPALLLK